MARRKLALKEESPCLGKRLDSQEAGDRGIL